jgi:selenocysteine lyase/cysteine desulfurase
MPILASQKHLFDIPAGVTYLNCAYMSPLSHAVLEAGRRGLAWKARPWELRPRDFFSLANEARGRFAKLLGAPATAEDVAIVPAASYGMAVACANLPIAPGQRVIAMADEFPSTILSWRARARQAGAEFVLVPRPGDEDWTAAVAAAIDSRTAVVAAPYLHWFSGARLDLAELGRRVRAVGAALVLDLTQSLGASSIDLAAVDPDFLVAACYKWLMGPYSVGFLYVAPRRQQGQPLEHHWFGRRDSENFSALTDYPDEFQPGGRRFDVGEPSNFALLPAAIAAIDQIFGWGVENIGDTAGALVDEIVERGAGLGLRGPPARLRARHYVGLRADRGLPADIAERLAAARVHVSVRGGQSLRITPHVYNERADVDRLFEVLTEVMGPR